LKQNKTRIDIDTVSTLIALFQQMNESIKMLELTIINFLSIHTAVHQGNLLAINIE